MLMAMFLIVGCQTTQSSETETKLEVVKNKLTTVNPFKNNEILAEQLVTSSKPVVCGRADAILNNMYTKYGERPVFLGESKALHPTTGNIITPMVTITYNNETGSFTVFEQMPLEERLLCILVVGVGNFKNMTKGTSL
jgi:hypothetical protein